MTDSKQIVNHQEPETKATTHSKSLDKDLLKQQKTIRSYLLDAKKYGKKNRSITIRINETVLDLLKERAKLLGMPYQSLISGNLLTLIK